MRSKCDWRDVCRATEFVAKTIPAVCVSLVLSVPANAQFWGSWGYPQREQPRQQYSPFSGWFGQPENRPQYRSREREAPPQYRKRQREAPSQARERGRDDEQPDYSRAPAPRRKQNAGVTTTILVMGDAMADWLAYGLEEAFAEKPEIAVTRKHRTTSGLVRYEPGRETEWAQVAREIIASEKPKLVVMMIGVNDREPIREGRRPPAGPELKAARSNAAAPAVATARPPQSDLELQAQQSADQQNAELQDLGQPTRQAPEEPASEHTGTFDFHTEKWEAAYIKRIDATISGLKSAGVPVFWVGLPAQRGSKATSDSAYLNELFRQRAEKAGIFYVDVWDGFVDEGGRFAAQGPDFEGQTRRLRSGDGIYFTKAGARKLAHYVEREIQRNLSNRAIPVALPAPQPTSRGPQSNGSAERPLAGPVVPLTTPSAESDELLGGARPPQRGADPIATSVLSKGESLPAPSGRADDFRWPRKDVVTSEPTTAGASTAAHTTTGSGQGRSSARRGKKKGTDERPAPPTAAARP
jgi:hypothetical protein